MKKFIQGFIIGISLVAIATVPRWHHQTPQVVFHKTSVQLDLKENKVKFYENGCFDVQNKLNQYSLRCI